MTRFCLLAVQSPRVREHSFLSLSFLRLRHVRGFVLCGIEGIGRTQFLPEQACQDVQSRGPMLRQHLFEAHERSLDTWIVLCSRLKDPNEVRTVPSRQVDPNRCVRGSVTAGAECRRFDLLKELGQGGNLLTESGLIPRCPPDGRLGHHEARQCLRPGIVRQTGIAEAKSKRSEARLPSSKRDAGGAGS